MNAPSPDDPVGAPAHPAFAQRLKRSDLWLLAALYSSKRPVKSITLITLLERADSLNHAIPFFDPISYGLPRLIDAGPAGSDGRRFWATPGGSALVRAAYKASGPDDFTLESLARLAGIPPAPLPERDDRSLGRLAGLSRENYDHAYAAYLRNASDSLCELTWWTAKWALRTLRRWILATGRRPARQRNRSVQLA